MIEFVLCEIVIFGVYLCNIVCNITRKSFIIPILASILIQAHIRYIYIYLYICMLLHTLWVTVIRDLVGNMQAKGFRTVTYMLLSLEHKMGKQMVMGLFYVGPFFVLGCGQKIRWKFNSAYMNNEYSTSCG